MHLYRWGLHLGAIPEVGWAPFSKHTLQPIPLSMSQTGLFSMVELGFRNVLDGQAFDDGSLMIYGCSQCRLRPPLSLAACGMNRVLAPWRHLFSVPPLGSG